MIIYGHPFCKTTLLIYDTGRIAYIYYANEGTDDEIKMQFSLLSEVGERWVATFRKIIQEFGLNVQHGYDDGVDIYDRVVKEEGGHDAGQSDRS